MSLIEFQLNANLIFIISDSQQKHNPKSKHSAPNHNVTSQSNKGSKAAPQPDTSANMVANVKQTAPSAVKEQQQQQQQPQPQQQPTIESKPAVPVTVQPEPAKVDSTNSGRSSEKTKQQQPPQPQPQPQPAEKVHSEESVTKRYVPILYVLPHFNWELSPKQR